MSLMKMIARYDHEQMEYIRELEGEVARLREQLSEAGFEAMRAASSRERSTLELIMAGAFDNDALERMRANRKTDDS